MRLKVMLVGLSIISLLLVVGCSNKYNQVELNKQINELESTIEENNMSIKEHEDIEIKEMKCLYCDSEVVYDEYETTSGYCNGCFCNYNIDSKKNLTIVGWYCNRCNSYEQSYNVTVDKEKIYISYCDSCKKELNELVVLGKKNNGTIEDSQFQICYDCGEYYNSEYMLFDGVSRYHCGCFISCGQCGSNEHYDFQCPSLK